MTNLQANSNVHRWIPKSQIPLLVVVSLMALINSAVLGFDASMIGGILNLPSYNEYFELTTATIGLNGASMWMGEILCVLTIMQWSTDKLGRKISILIGTVITIIGIAIQSGAQNIAMFVVGRIILGFGAALGNTAAPTLIAEISPAKYRGILVGGYFTCFQVGALVASGVTYASRNAPGTWSWRIPSIVQGVPSIASLILLFFCPESPHWLIMNNREEEAIEILCIVENVDAVGAKAITRKIAILGQQLMNSSANVWKTLLVRRENWCRLFILVTQSFLNEFGGSSISNYYSLFLDQAGVTDYTQKLQVGIVMSAWSVVLAAFGAYAFDVIGRKKLALISLCGMIICNFVIGGMIKAFEGTENHSGSYATIFFFFMFNGFYAFTFTPLSCLYSAELFPYSTRVAGQTFYKFWNEGLGLAAQFVSPFGLDNLGWKFFMVIAGYSVIFVPIIYYVWVETKGVPIEEVEKLFQRPKAVDAEASDPESVAEIEKELVVVGGISECK